MGTGTLDPPLGALVNLTTDVAGVQDATSVNGVSNSPPPVATCRARSTPVGVDSTDRWMSAAVTTRCGPIQPRGSRSENSSVFSAAVPPVAADGFDTLEIGGSGWRSTVIDRAGTFPAAPPPVR